MNYDSEAVKMISKMIVYSIKQNMNSLPFNYYKDGNIVQNLGNGKYVVNIEGTNYTVPSLNQIDTYTVGQIVKICIPNGNFKKKFIEGYVKY